MTDIVDADYEDVTDAKKQEKSQPLYQIFPESRIPVSRATGPLWKTKLDAAKQAYQQAYMEWDEAYKYYRFSHGQTMAIGKDGEIVARGDLSENIVFANLNITVPAIYSKNPDLSCTTSDPDDKGFVSTIQTLLNTLVHKKSAPGIGLKAKARRQVLHAELTNFGVLKLDWVSKQDSVENVVQQLEMLSKELLDAKTQKDIEVVNGKIMALEAQLEVAEPSGARLKILRQDITESRTEWS